MLKKLIPALLVITLFAHPVHCEDIKEQAKFSKRQKIIIAAAITAVALGTTLAAVSFAPEHCPTIIRKCVPDALILASAKDVYKRIDNEILESLEKNLNETSHNQQGTNDANNKRELQPEDWNALEEDFNTLQNEVSALSQAPDADKKLCSHLNDQLKYTLNYKKSLSESPHNANFASSLSRHLKNALTDIDSLKQKSNAPQFLNIANQLAPQMKDIARNLDNTYGNAEHYWLGHKPLS